MTNAWPRGLVCTVRPESSLTSRRRRRGTYVTRKKIEDGSHPNFEALYSRVSELARAREEELRRTCELVLSAKVIARGWDVVAFRNGAMAFATLTLDFTEGTDRLETGVAIQAAPDFRYSYASELFLLQNYEGPVFDELYIDFDFRTSSNAPGWVLSYGEYAEQSSSDLAPFIIRAEQRAAFYADTLERPGAPMPRHVRTRDCKMLEHIGKKTGPNNLVDVLLTFDEGRD